MSEQPKLDFESRLAGSLAERTEPGCLEGEALVELAEQGRAATDFERRMAHVAGCARCYGLLKDLRAVPALAAAPARPSGRRWLWLLIPAAALILFALVRQGQNREREDRFVREQHAPPEARFDPGFGPPKQGPREARGPEPEPPPEARPEVAPDPGRDFVPFEVPERPSGEPQRLPGNLVEREGRLFEGEVPIEDFVAADVRAVASEPENIRGPNAVTPPEIVLEKPEIGNRLLRQANPTFSWSRYPGATGYDVTLERLPDPSDPASAQVELEMSGLTAQAKSPLQAGRNYRLRLVAKVPGDPTGDRNPRAEYLFRVPNAEERRKLDWATANESKAPLAAAMVYLAIGRLADAERVMPRTTEPQLLAWRRNIEESLKRRLSEPDR